MNKHPFDTLSADQRENVRSALVAAFGSAPIGAVMPITGGASTASTFRVDVGGRGYLLRVEGQPSPLRNPLQYVSMPIAAEAGIAPGIHYIDETARVAVIDFVEHQHLSGGAAHFGESARRVDFARSGHALLPVLRQLCGHRRAPVRACAANRSVCGRRA
jgi:hypothetical protein